MPRTYHYGLDHSERSNPFYTGPIKKARKAISMAKVKKGMEPAPVYVAHFANGDLLRMSFWQMPGKPWDYKRGRNLCAGTVFAGGRKVVNGYIIDKRDGTEYRDPLIDPSAKPLTVSKPRVTAKQYRDALAALAAYSLPGPALDQARELLNA